MQQTSILHAACSHLGQLSNITKYLVYARIRDLGTVSVHVYLFRDVHTYSMKCKVAWYNHYCTVCMWLGILHVHFHIIMAISLLPHAHLLYVYTSLEYPY